MKSVFSKLFLGLLCSSLLILVIISFIITLAIRTSISSWNEGKKEDLETLLIPLVSKAYRLNGGLSGGVLEDDLAPYLTDSLYVRIFDADRNPIFIFNGGNGDGSEEEKADWGNGGLFSSTPVEIRDGEETIAYLDSNTVDFLADKANRSFIDTMIKAVAIGICVTFFLSLVIAGYISSGFARQTKNLVIGILNLTRGERNVSFPDMGIRELDQISRSALKLQNQLAKEEQLRRQWMQDIAHDLKTPLTAVISQFEAMVDGALRVSPERVKSLLSEILRMEALVLNLQELSRYESPEMALRKRPISSMLFLDDLKERFLFLAEQKGIPLDFSGGQFFFDADEPLMQRCLSNIIQNALQYTPPGGRVEVAIWQDSSRAVFKIRNTGHIPEKDLMRIFDRLYRGSRSRDGQGCGLGLSIAMAIAKIHGGSLEAENSGGDVVFTMKIPISVCWPT